MAKFICSRLASDNVYPIWEPAKKGENGDMPRNKKQVLVKGKSGIADKNLITPYGVVTEVSDDDYKALQESKSFQKHVDNSYLKVLDKDPGPKDVKKVADDLQEDTGSAPLNDEKLKKENLKPGKTNPKKA